MRKINFSFCHSLNWKKRKLNITKCNNHSSFKEPYNNLDIINKSKINKSGILHMINFDIPFDTSEVYKDNNNKLLRSQKEQRKRIIAQLKKTSRTNILAKGMLERILHEKKVVKDKYVKEPYFLNITEVVFNRIRKNLLLSSYTKLINESTNVNAKNLKFVPKTSTRNSPVHSKKLSFELEGKSIVKTNKFTRLNKNCKVHRSAKHKSEKSEGISVIIHPPIPFIKTKIRIRLHNNNCELRKEIRLPVIQAIEL